MPASIWFALVAAQIPVIDAPVQTQYATRYAEVKVGDGALAEPGKVFEVHYTLWLPDGKKIDSSVDRGVAFRFEQGKRRVISGWEAGFEGMRVGGKRRLFIPYQLGYGERGRGPIPPKSELVFDIELLGVHDPVPLRKAAAPPAAKYVGIRADQPTGSAATSADALLAAFDMETLTPDGRLRDFGPAGRHATVRGTALAAGGGSGPGKSRMFGGKDELEFPAPALGGEFTIAVRVKLDRGGSRRTLAACEGGFTLDPAVDRHQEGLSGVGFEPESAEVLVNPAHDLPPPC